MMELKLQLSDMDYGALVERLLPLLHDSAKDSLFGKIPFLTEHNAKAVLARLPQETKDRLLADLINRNQTGIAASLEKTLAKEGIAVKITAISADNKK